MSEPNLPTFNVVKDLFGDEAKRSDQQPAHVCTELWRGLIDRSCPACLLAEENEKILFSKPLDPDWCKRSRESWLPIDSCPLTGKRVELWCQHLETIKAGQEYATFGHYEAGDDYEQWLDDHGYALSPTHWRDEPAGPNESKPDQETKGER